MCHESHLHEADVATSREVIRVLKTRKWAQMCYRELKVQSET